MVDKQTNRQTKHSTPAAHARARGNKPNTPNLKVRSGTGGIEWELSGGGREIGGLKGSRLAGIFAIY